MDFPLLMEDKIACALSTLEYVTRQRYEPALLTGWCNAEYQQERNTLLWVPHNGQLSPLKVVADNSDLKQKYEEKLKSVDMVQWKVDKGF